MTETTPDPADFPLLTPAEFAAALRAASAGTVLPSLHASPAIRGALADVADASWDDVDLAAAVRDARAAYRDEIAHHAPHLADQAHAQIHW